MSVTPNGQPAHRRGCVHMMREECRCSSLGLSYPIPRLLASDQCCSPALYVCWRVMCAMYHIGWIVYDWIVDAPSTWLIYLSNWSFLILTLSTIIRAVIVVFVRCSAKDFRDGQTPWYMKVSWVLYEVASAAALGVTILYFGLLFDGTLTLLNGAYHLGNSIYVILDLFITAMPVRLLHVIYAMIYAVVYAVFTVVYWAAGGINREGESFIYKPLDWDNPQTAAPVAVGAVFVAAPVVHLIVWLLFMIRVAIHRNCCVEEQDYISTSEMRETRGGGDPKLFDVN